MENSLTDVPLCFGGVGRCSSGCHMPRHLCTLPHSHCHERGWNCGCTNWEAKNDQVWTFGLEPLLCAFYCGDIWSTRWGSWGICGGAWSTPLQDYRRTPQSRVPSATHFNHHAKGKCSSSPWHHGEATAELLRVNFACWYTCMIT